MAGENYTFPMPTEKLKTELAAANETIQRLRAELTVRKQAACPDLRCENCRKVNGWLAEHGDVNWLVCQTCQAGVGEPCRHAGRGVGRSHGSRPPVLRRPHRGRPWRKPDDEPLV